MRRATLIWLLSAAATTGHANEDWMWNGSLGPAAGYMDYREIGSDGRRLNREQGTLPGIVASLRGRSADWSVGAELSYFGGDVRYEGMTNTNNALRTRTDQRIAAGGVWLGLRAFENPTTQTTLYAGGGVRWWNRDIRSTPGAFGVDESYTWPYLLAGVRAERRLAGGDRASLDLRLLRPVDAALHVDFKNDYDSADVDPEARVGGRLGLTWTRPWSDGRTLAVSVWYERWRFDASDAEILRRNGVAIGTVHEPESETEFVGVAVSLGGLSF